MNVHDGFSSLSIGTVCENYCDKCKLSSCPCYDLPLKKSGEENCIELSKICGNDDKKTCAWDVIDMPTNKAMKSTNEIHPILTVLLAVFVVLVN